MYVRKTLIPLVVLSVLVAACSSSSSPSTGSGSQGNGEVSFGTAGNPNDADTTIRVTQLDDLRFDPERLHVSVGDTVRFLVANAGAIPHEFVLGDESLQGQHEQEMAGMDGMMMSDEPNAISVEPGEMKTLAWTFSVAGTVIFGCHVPGHYAGGMRGEIEVSE